MSRLHLQFALLMIAIAASADATGLYAVYTGPAGPGGRSLWRIDPATASSQPIASLPTRNWLDIAARPGDSGGVYAVSNVFESGWKNRLSRIDVTTGAVSDLHTLTASGLGYSGQDLELDGISIAPSLPDVATVKAQVFDFSTGSTITTLLFDVDLLTGNVSNLQEIVGTSVHGDLTLADDGTLFTLVSDEPRRLGTIDRTTSTVTPIGTCQGCSVRAIEPGSAALLALGLIGFGIRRRRA